MKKITAMVLAVMLIFFTGDMCFRGGTTKAKQRGGAICFVQL
jgi:hypothetical protein